MGQKDNREVRRWLNFLRKQKHTGDKELKTNQVSRETSRLAMHESVQKQTVTEYCHIEMNSPQGSCEASGQLGSVGTTAIDQVAAPVLTSHSLLPLSPHLYSVSHDLLQDNGLSDWSRTGCLEKKGDHELYVSSVDSGQQPRNPGLTFCQISGRMLGRSEPDFRCDLRRELGDGVLGPKRRKMFRG